MENPQIWQLEPTKGPDEALIIVRGFRGEGSFRGATEDYWMSSIREMGWQGSIYHLWWDASDPDNFNNIFAIHSWQKSKDRAKRVGTIYFKRLVRKEVLSKSISLIGHSLGARVIYYALKEWSATSQEIKNVVLLGGAIRENKDWHYVSSNVSGCIFNLYNSKDPVLKFTYQLGEFFLASDPCGLKPIEKADSKIVNIDVTSLVESKHSESDYLYSLKKNKFKIWKKNDEFIQDPNILEIKPQVITPQLIKEAEKNGQNQPGEDARKLRQKLEETENVQVSIALFGQPGAGKSSLVNCLTGQRQAEVGIKNDITVKEKAYEWNGLHLVDLPGYGTQMFPVDTYFKEFEIEKFDCILCVFSGVRLKEDDVALFRKLKAIGKSCIFVCNKTDTLWDDDRKPDEIQEEIQGNLEQETGIQERVYFTSCKDKQGLGELTEAIFNLLGSAGEEKQERWALAAKSYSSVFLEEKRKACQKHIIMSAGASAANGVNPIPGVDVAIDLMILEELFKKIRLYYGLNEDQVNEPDVDGTKWASAAKKVFEYGTKKGILLLIKKFIGRTAAKQAAKYIPFVGPAIAASIGFSVTLAAGNSYLDECHALAEATLKAEKV